MNMPDSITHAREASERLTALIAELTAALELAYLESRKALEQGLTHKAHSAREREIRQTLLVLEKQISGLASTVLRNSVFIGNEQWQADAKLFEVGWGRDFFIPIEDRDNAQLAIDADTNRQIRLILALLLFGINSQPNRNFALVFGGKGRVGLFTPAPIVQSIDFWATTLAAQAYENGAAKIAAQLEAQGVTLGRIAVLGTNRDHTETCLNVSGQIVGMTENFKLTGTPKYADEMFAPPFHWHCYTRVGLVKL